MTRRAAAMGSAALVLASLTAGTPARAQAPTPVQKADALFNAGESLLEAGEYADACPKFAEANTLAPGLGVSLYLADCYERLGRTASALTEFRHAAALAKTRGDKRAAVATTRADALVHRVPKLVVNVSPTAMAENIHVSLDGQPLPKSAWGSSAAIDPGDHVLEATAEGRVSRTVTLHLAPDDKTHTETIPELDAPAESALVPLGVPPPAAGMVVPAGKDRRFLWIAAGSAGAGVVGLLVGAGLGFAAKSKLGDSNNGPCDATDHCSAAGLSLRSDAETLGNASTAAFVLGGIAIAAGATVFVVRARTGSPGASVAVSPLVGRGVAGMSVGGAL